jgi:hypothetical protein
MTIPWRRLVHGLSVTMVFLVLSACIVYASYAAVVLYGLTGYIAITTVVLFIWLWSWLHPD